MDTRILINRVPVLTLWAAAVAERQGYDWEESLSLGRAVALLTTQNKGEHSGEYEKASEEGEHPRKPAAVAPQFIELCGRNVPINRTIKATRAMSGGKEVHPEEVQAYLADAFGDDLTPTLKAMRKLARSFSKDELQVKAVELFQLFSPKSGNKGNLDINKILQSVP